MYSLKYYYDLIHNDRELIAKECELKLKILYYIKEIISRNLLQINEMYDKYVTFNNLLDFETIHLLDEIWVLNNHDLEWFNDISLVEKTLEEYIEGDVKKLAVIFGFCKYFDEFAKIDIKFDEDNKYLNEFYRQFDFKEETLLSYYTRKKEEKTDLDKLIVDIIDYKIPDVSECDEIDIQYTLKITKEYLEKEYFKLSKDIYEVMQLSKDEMLSLANKKNKVAEFVFYMIFSDVVNGNYDNDYFVFLKDSASQNYPPALYVLGIYYLSDGADEKWHNLNKIGASYNFFPCVCDYAMSFAFGTGVPQDINKAISLMGPYIKKMSDKELDETLLTWVLGDDEILMTINDQSIKILEERIDNHDILELLIRLLVVSDGPKEKIVEYCSKIPDTFPLLLDIYSETHYKNNEMNNLFLRFFDNEKGSIECIMKQIFDKDWDLVSNDAKSCLITGIHVYFLLKKLYLDGVEIDFSPVISSLSKALEIELRQKIYLRYIQYLKEKNISFDLLPNKNLFKDVKTEVGTIKQYDEFFTLGKFEYIVKKTNTDRAYSSYFIDFMKEITGINKLRSTFFKSYYEKNLVTYIGKLISGVRELTTLYRNDAVHNKIMNCNEAEACGNYIMLVRKLILDVVKLENHLLNE